MLGTGGLMGRKARDVPDVLPHVSANLAWELISRSPPSAGCSGLAWAAGPAQLLAHCV